MNFFGHAEVASWFRSDPAFVLGAMLPDFFSMLGVKRPNVHAGELAAGIALHHLTDAAFHDIPEFTALVADGRAALSAAGLARGSARAAAHIGVELLLDEVLASEPLGGRAYLSAIGYGARAELPVVWEGDDGARFRELMAILVQRGLPEPASEPSRVARRLRSALASRPRLAFSIAEEPAVGEWVVRARRAVVGCSETILAELRSRLRAGVDPGDRPDSPQDRPD